MIGYCCALIGEKYGLQHRCRVLKNKYAELGYIKGATVRQYHNIDLFDDATILYVHDNGALDVEIEGIKYGWGVRFCVPLRRLEAAAKDAEDMFLNGTSDIEPKGFLKE